MTTLAHHWLTRYCAFAATVINADHKRVGGIHFFKIGRLTFSFCVSRAYRPIR